MINDLDTYNFVFWSIPLCKPSLSRMSSTFDGQHCFPYYTVSSLECCIGKKSIAMSQILGQSQILKYRGQALLTLIHMSWDLTLRIRRTYSSYYKNKSLTRNSVIHLGLGVVSYMYDAVNFAGWLFWGQRWRQGNIWGELWWPRAIDSRLWIQAFWPTRYQMFKTHKCSRCCLHFR